MGGEVAKRRVLCEEQRPRNAAAVPYVMYNNLIIHQLTHLRKFSLRVYEF